MIIDVKTLPQYPLFEGGEGLIYKWGDQCLKVYKPHVDKKLKEQKVLSLLKKTLPACVVSPTEPVYDQKKAFIGFTMPWVQSEEFKRLSSRAFIKSNQIKMKDILSMLIKVKDALKILHGQGITIGDLNESNVSFDFSGNIYFLDTDSWAVDSLTCDVCMDSFKDPLLQGNHFSPSTDAYAFAVLAFKCLTRLHPFGGTMVPELSLLDRMQRRMSVLSSANVAIPKNIIDWRALPPNLLRAFTDIFDDKNRDLLDIQLDNFIQNITFCKTHNGDYYSKFNTCPICDQTAKVQTKPIAIPSQTGIPNRSLRAFVDAEVFLDKEHYVTTTGEIVHIPTGKTSSISRGEQIRFSTDGHVKYHIQTDLLTIHFAKQKYVINKAFKSKTMIVDRNIYFVDANLTLCAMNVDPKGNSLTPLTKVSPRHAFSCQNDTNFACINFYDHMTVFQIDGHFYTRYEAYRFREVFFHFDIKLNHWLIVGELEDGSHHLFVFNKGECLAEQNQIKLAADVEDLCFDNGILFMPSDGKIRGFHVKNNVYKDFLVPQVQITSKLFRQNNKFICLNSHEMIEIG